MLDRALTSSVTTIADEVDSRSWIGDLGEIADIEPSRTDRAFFKVIGLDLSDAVAIGYEEVRGASCVSRFS
jgi:hypothetical protein